MIRPATKYCGKCKTTKSVAAFFTQKRKTRISLSSWCRDCHNEYRRDLYRRYPDRERAGSRKRYERKRPLELQRKYNMSTEDYEQLLSEQNNSCAICGKHQSEFKRHLNVDHNHLSEKVRGLLCGKCNMMIGMAGDDRDILAKAIKYLEKHAKINGE